MGPVAPVVASRLTGSDRAWLGAYVRSISTHVDGSDFWVIDTDEPGSGGRPFIWETRGSDGRFNDVESFRREFGFDPGAEVIISAMCNSHEDHRILGRVCMAVARHLRGVIDFAGRLEGARGGSSDAGKVVEVDHRHVGTPDFLSAWLMDPNFHMVK
jgi:hypothetical protein